LLPKQRLFVLLSMVERVVIDTVMGTRQPLSV
jgi:hypothetical protein